MCCDMKRTVIVVVVLAVLVAGCGGPGEAPDNETDNETEEPAADNETEEPAADNETDNDTANATAFGLVGQAVPVIG